MSSLLASKLVSLFQEMDCQCTSLFVLAPCGQGKVLGFSFDPTKIIIPRSKICLCTTYLQYPQHINRLLTGIAVDPTAPTNAEREQAKEVAKDQFLVVMFLLNCDRNQYGNLVCDIENEYTCGTDTYPTSLSAAYDYLVNYRVETRSSLHDPDEGGLSYYTEDGDGSR